MRLIDADEVKETIRHRTKLVEWQKGIIWALIDMHKTVDAVPVIRCKDCKWWRDTDHTCKNFMTSPRVPSDFCSRAERRKDDSN